MTTRLRLEYPLRFALHGQDDAAYAWELVQRLLYLCADSLNAAGARNRSREILAEVDCRGSLGYNQFRHFDIFRNTR